MPSGDSANALREVWMEGYNRGLSESGRKSVERADKAQDEVARLAPYWRNRRALDAESELRGA